MTQTQPRIYKKSDGESSETTEDKVNNSQTEEPAAPSNDSTEKSSTDKTSQDTSKNDTTSSGTTTQKPSSGTTTEPPSTGNNSSSDSTNTQKPSSGSDNTENSSGSNSAGNSNQGVTDSQLKSEADSNASKYQNYYQEVLRLVNEIRAEVGVAPLTLDMTLCKAASMRALEMDYNNIMSHTRPDGSDWWTVLEFYEAPYGTCGENVAAGYRSPATVVEGWKNSPGHYQNMITETFTKLGVGYSSVGVGDYGHYWCQLFSD